MSSVPERLPRVTGHCATHGETLFVLRSDGKGRRYLRCRAEAVSRRRRRVKALLVAEAGGRCAACGYDRYLGALEFHHADPSTKQFALGNDGITRSIAVMRSEAAKCVLLCANCHAEIEAGLITAAQLPIQST